MGSPLDIALGTVGLAGGGPTTITDDFTTDSGEWLDGNLAAAAMTIASGRGIWTPTLGDEIVTNGNMETGDPPASWTYAGTIIADQIAEERTGGAGIASLSLTLNGGVSGSAKQTLGLTVGNWYRCNVWGKVPAGNPAVYYEVSLSNDPGKTFPGGWNNKNTTFRAISAAPTMGLLVYQAASTGEGRFDDVSIKPITFSTQFRLRRIYYVSYVETAIRRTSGTQKGVTLFYDINNYIKTWIGTESVYLIKCVGGVVSAVLGTGAIVYAADALLRLVPNAAFNAFSVNYGGTEVIAPVSITNFNPAGIWYAGVFNTYNGGDIAADSFENFAAVAVGA